MSFVSMGTVYGTALNFQVELAARGDVPQSPVLYIKPANTWSAHEAEIALPAGATEAEVGATVAMVMQAPGELAGYVLMNDLSLPHAGPLPAPLTCICPDGFLGVGGTFLHKKLAGEPSEFVVEVRINGELRQTVKFDALVRGPAQLLADVSDFMTLGAGDVLMLGCGADRPRARAGDRIEISAPGMGVLANTLAQAAP